MLSYESNGGRLGENISFLYGLFKFCKINGISYDNIIVDINYKNTPLAKTEKEEYVFRENLEMFSNIKYVFKEIPENYFKNFIKIDIACQTDIAQLKNFYLYNNIDKNTNIIFKNWWSLDKYWRIRDMFFDLELLNFICRPKKLVNKIKKQFKSILKKQCVALHIRRGDYMGMLDNNILYNYVKNNINSYFKSKKIYSVLEIETIIKYLYHNNYNILIFSDDIDWCKNNFNIYKNTYFPHGKPYEDMILMSLCDNVIVNNGSFFSLVPYILCKGYKND
jgi:hypothetical protein